MKKGTEFTLMDGVYDPQDAKAPLITLLGSLSQWHSMEDFSSKIRFGVNNTYHQQEVIRLSDTIIQLREALDSAQKQGLRLYINAHIQIQPETKP